MTQKLSKKKRKKRRNNFFFFKMKKTFEELELPQRRLGDKAGFLKENTVLTVAVSDGTIVDIVRDGLGVEVIVDISREKAKIQKTMIDNHVEVAALITAESAKTLNLHCGKKVRISFKASAVKYVEE